MASLFGPASGPAGKVKHLPLERKRVLGEEYEVRTVVPGRGGGGVGLASFVGEVRVAGKAGSADGRSCNGNLKRARSAASNSHSSIATRQAAE